MATAHVQTVDVQTASGTTVTKVVTTTAGNHLSMNTGTGTNKATAAPTVSNGGSVLNALADMSDGSGTGASHQREDYQENVAGGSTTITFKAASATEITGCVSESSGVATSASLGAVNHAVSASAHSLATGSITPTAGSILYSGTTDAGGSTTADTIDNAFTISSDATAWNGVNQRAGRAHKDNVTATAINPTWTEPTGQTNGMTALIVEYLAAAGGTTVNLAGTLAGTGTLTANMLVSLSTTLAGVGAMVASPILLLGSSLAGVGALVASPLLLLTSSLAGVGTFIASFPAPIALVMTAAGVGTLVASPVLFLSSTLAGLGTLVVSPIVALSALLVGVGTFSAGMILSLATALASVGTLTAGMVQTVALSVVSSGVSTLTAALSGAVAAGIRHHRKARSWFG